MRVKLKNEPRFQMKEVKAKPKANDLTKTILQYLRFNGVCCWRQNNAAIYDAAKQTFRANSVGMKGVADVLGVMKDGRFIAIEIKTTDKQSEEQKEFEQEITKRGGVYVVARSVDDVIKVFMK